MYMHWFCSGLEILENIEIETRRLWEEEHEKLKRQKGKGPNDIIF